MVVDESQWGTIESLIEIETFFHQKIKAMGFFLIKPQGDQDPTFLYSGLAVKLIGPSCPDDTGLQNTWSRSTGLCPAQLAGYDL